MKKIILFLIGLIGFEYITFGQENDSLNFTYEYMTIVAEYPARILTSITITKPNGSVEKIRKKVLGNNQENLETTDIINLLEKYSKEGWIVVSSNMTGVDNSSFNFYYLLKRKKTKR